MSIHSTNRQERDNFYAQHGRPIESVYEYIAYLEKGFPAPIVHFRGEAKKYPVPFQPTVWRDAVPISDRVPFAGGILTIAEKNAIDAFKAHYLAGGLHDPYMEQRTIPDDDSYEWILLAQHYGYATRLVDVTRDPMVGLYFACCKHFDDDGYVYAGTPGAGNPFDHYQHSKSFLHLFDVYNVGDNKPKEDTLFYFRPLANNRRMIAQRGEFLWCRGIDKDCWRSGLPVKIAANAKRRIILTLEKWGYDEQHLLPPTRRPTTVA